MAEVEQVPHGRPGAAGLVGVDDGVAVAGVGVDHHDLDVRRQCDGRRVEQVDLHDDDDGVDGQFPQPGERAAHLVLGGHGDREQRDRVALAAAAEVAIASRVRMLPVVDEA